MYGVKDCNGYEIEVGDRVKVVCVTRWANNLVDERKAGDIGGVVDIEDTTDPEDAFVSVTFSDDPLWDFTYYGADLEILPRA